MAVRHHPPADPETLVMQPKEPLTPVAGPYGHPFHPMLVTLPIGAWVSSFVLDIASRIDDQPAGLARGAYWLVGIGIAGALAAALFGLMDYLRIPPGTRAKTFATVHMLLNYTVIGLFAVNMWWRTRTDFAEGVDTGPIVLSALTLAVLGVSGWLGGELSYRYGVRVVDQRTQTEGFR